MTSSLMTDKYVSHTYPPSQLLWSFEMMYEDRHDMFLVFRYMFELSWIPPVAYARQKKLYSVSDYAWKLKLSAWLVSSLYVGVLLP